MLQPSVSNCSACAKCCEIASQTKWHVSTPAARRGVPMERCEELTATYLDDALSPAEMLELDNHLRAAPQAARQFTEFYVQDRILTELYRSEDIRAIETIMADVRREEGALVESVMEEV